MSVLLIVLIIQKREKIINAAFFFVCLRLWISSTISSLTVLLQFKERLNASDRNKIVLVLYSWKESVLIFLLLPLHHLWHLSIACTEPVQVTGRFLQTPRSTQSPAVGAGGEVTPVPGRRVVCTAGLVQLQPVTLTSDLPLPPPVSDVLL